MEHLNKNNILTFLGELKQKIYNLTFSDGKSYIRSDVKPDKPETFSFSRLEEIISSTLSLLSKVYGEKSEMVKDFSQKIKKYSNHIEEEHMYLYCCLGKLNTLESDINFGLLTTFEKEISGEIFANFLNLAKYSLNEQQKDVAAVLACAALEDTLKKIAKLQNLSVDDKNMGEVVNALKREGLIRGSQSGLLSAYVSLRNKAFHAEWNKIESPDVSSLIGFTEELVLKNFS